MPPTEESIFQPPLRLDPLLNLDPSSKITLDEAPPAKSGDVAHGDPLQNYAVVIEQMVHRHLRYPAAARPRREKGVVTVSLDLARDGTLLKVHADTENRADFATAVIAAAHAAAPFPPFPRALHQSEAIINFSFVFLYSDAE